jgi:NADH-quinone oxidoreductase subunit C
MSEIVSPSEGQAAEPAKQDELVAQIAALGLDAIPYERKADCSAVQVLAPQVLPLMMRLRDDSDFCFDMLTAHTVVDRLEQNVFELVYYLYSLKNRKRLLVSVSIPRDNPVVATLSQVWKIAEFQEREAYDLFGIQYDNHPDLRRVFLEDDWKGFPLRKDYQDDFMLTHVIAEES